MLILSRKANEQIALPDLNITVTVVRVGHNRVQLGIDAPGTVRIVRSEIIAIPEEPVVGAVRHDVSFAA